MTSLSGEGHTPGMGRRRLLIALAVTVVVASGAGAYTVVRHQHALPSVGCRDLLEPAQVHRLPAAVVRDLDDPAFGVDVDSLGTPPVHAVDDVRQAMQAEHAGLRLGPGPRDALACASGHANELLLVRREGVPLEHCYGPGGCPTERRTCADRYTLSGTVGRHHDLGCPDLG